MRLKDIFKVTTLPVIFASLCCLSPLVLVMVGLSTAAFAASLSDILYFQYKWHFRILGIILLAIGLFYYFRSKGICTLDQARRHRNEIINTSLIALIASIIGYIIFLYVIVDYVGILYGIWE